VNGVINLKSVMTVFKTKEWQLLDATSENS